MATIKAIEARSVHQIQSGQVIVDFCSVAKELVENSLDAGATSIEVRFKNNGLDLIEVQDNGSGISPENYENIALKHYTSKLYSYDDLTRLKTFGFRGEALSSLCALSDFHIVTAQANQAPKANRLDFEVSGKLKKTQIIAGQKGTTASVEGLFKKLPVRRRELEKNIKREYGKVLNLLNAYACICTGVRFSVRNTVGKTKNVVVFTTNGNQTTKENIANVYGAKTLSALIPLDLTLEFEPSVALRRGVGGDQGEPNKILVKGHISRPVFGEGRQTPDRQMFFVNSRPCGLPQIAKAFNEVYKSFNVSQSPFIFADFHMDTDAYDVNVSPDKRTILLHDAGAMIESLKSSLTELFETSDQTVPQSQVLGSKSSVAKHYSQSRLPDTLTPSKPSNLPEEAEDSKDHSDEEPGSSQPSTQNRLKGLLSGLDHRPTVPSPSRSGISESRELESSPITPRGRRESEVPETPAQIDTQDNTMLEKPPELHETTPQLDNGEGSQSNIEDDTPQSTAASNEQPISISQPDSQAEVPNAVQNAFDRMRPRRLPAEVATITVGNKTVTSMIGSGIPKKRGFGSASSGAEASERKRRIHTPSRPNIFGKYMKGFAAPGSQPEEDVGSQDDEDVEDEDEDFQDDQVDERSPSRSPSPDESVTQDRGLPDASINDSVETNDAEPSAGPDGNDIDEETKKAKEEAEVQRLIQEAEEKAVLPQENNVHRANKLNKGAAHRDSTVRLISTINGSLSTIQSQMDKLQDSLQSQTIEVSKAKGEAEAALSQETAEESLSLTVTKDDFSKMRIIGQFNLGFIIATRSSDDRSDGLPSKDELFIIDQHASDEKFNFERLQAETVVQNQRLVQPKTLDLTAVEEEIVLENRTALEKNGFIVEIDDSGNEPIGRRCKLVSLPLSKEVVFGIRDLEELIALLSESPTLSTSAATSDAYIPRPSKVRKMFAMRACRSSIMIGKTLTQKQMARVVRNMGTIDKPWNCPHGRPTMRHLMSLGQWDEWDEFSGGDEEGDRLNAWRTYFQETAEESEDEDDEAEDEEDEE
ncbi:DNA mismatch repair protein [Aspergillus sclerotialis]|uniref:DNA mismatch repair protein PMS1 n=1 Tax=Aspergillus sclerotialis TaxID=2070753 RepID=A0A3A2Z8B5_9EURO|nr:DNA mismatch repair protein [Aspergillus sclerotialis]